MNKLIPLSLLCIGITVAGIVLTKTRLNAKHTKTVQTATVSQTEAQTRLTYQMRVVSPPGKKSATQSNDVKRSTSQTSTTENDNFETQTFWVKVIFSSIFCMAALFVVLSNKYDGETKKWAFSVLSLISGVWIGSIQ